MNKIILLLYINGISKMQVHVKIAICRMYIFTWLRARAISLWINSQCGHQQCLEGTCVRLSTCNASPLLWNNVICFWQNPIELSCLSEIGVNTCWLPVAFDMVLSISFCQMYVIYVSIQDWQCTLYTLFGAISGNKFVFIFIVVNAVSVIFLAMIYLHAY